MKAMIVAAAIVGSQLYCSPASAYSIVDGNNLHSWCNSEPDTRGQIQEIFCTGYIRGVMDALFADQVRAGGKFCLPETVTNEQIIDVVKKYLRRNPQIRHYLGNVVIEMALADAFPSCRR